MERSVAPVVRKRVADLRRLAEQAAGAVGAYGNTRTMRGFVAAASALRALRKRCRVRVKDDGSVEVVVTVLRAPRQSSVGGCPPAVEARFQREGSYLLKHR